MTKINRLEVFKIKIFKEIEISKTSQRYEESKVKEPPSKKGNLLI